MNRTVKGYVYIVLSAVIFGCTPVIAKFIYADGVNALSLVFLRNILSVPILMAVMRMKRISFGVTGWQMKRIVPVGLLGCLITPGLLFMSYNYISSGMATTIHFIYPVFVLIGCAIFFHDRITKVRAMCVVLCTGGILFFYTPGEQSGLIGMVIAFISGITYAAYIIGLDKSGLQDLSPFKFSMYMCLESALVLFAFLMISGQMTLPSSPMIWLLCLGFSLSLSLVANILFQVGTKVVGPQNAAVLSTFEPITSIIMGIVVYAESFTWLTAVGAVLILAAVTLLAVAERGRGTPKGSEEAFDDGLGTSYRRDRDGPNAKLPQEAPAGDDSPPNPASEPDPSPDGPEESESA